MEQIDITEFKNYSPQLILQYLQQLLTRTLRLEILIEKKLTPEGRSIRWFTFRTYAEAAYAAHLLNSASKNFGYYTPCPSLIEPFRFVVDLMNTPALAKELHYIVSAYFDEDGEKHKEYLTKAHNFYCESWLKNIDSYPWGLLSVAGEAVSQFTEEDEEDSEKDI